MPGKNVELARKVRELTRRLPQVFDMGDWFYLGRGDRGDAGIRTAEEVLADPQCGTVACFAGWTCLLSGYAMDEDGFVYREGAKIQRRADATHWYSLHAATAARELLGIDPVEAERLFYARESDLDARLAEVFGETI
jgi:hypothetical protein